MPSRLSVELVPRTAWYSNVRSNVSRLDWERCKKFVRDRSGNTCEVCGGRGRRHAIECHEIWAYDDVRQIQTLVGLIALCPACHEVKHLGHAETRGRLDAACDHLMIVNGWSSERTFRYVAVAFEIWNMRSQVEWELDISWLRSEEGPLEPVVAPTNAPSASEEHP